MQHAADGTISVRADQTQYEAPNENLALQRHLVKRLRRVGFAEHALELLKRREVSAQ